MTETGDKLSRRDQILQALVTMLEKQPRCAHYHRQSGERSGRIGSRAVPAFSQQSQDV